MPTTAQRFYPITTADDQTFSGEATIREFDTAAPASNTATTITWTTTTITEKTVIPVTANSASGDSSNNNGWTFNNTATPADMASTATAQRRIKAGVWNFSMQITLNTPALLDTHALTIEANVYRVATGGGTRTLLFSATSANQTGSATVTWSSASQPEYVLDAGEVIMVGFTMTSASTTATVLGANTNTVCTVTLGTNTWFEVPSPGIETLSIGAFSASGAAVNAAVATGIFSGVFDADGLAATAAVGAAQGSGVFASDGVATVSGIGAWRFSGVFSGAGEAAASAVGASAFAGVFEADVGGGGGGGEVFVRPLFVFDD